MEIFLRPPDCRYWPLYPPGWPVHRLLVLRPSLLSIRPLGWPMHPLGTPQYGFEMLSLQIRIECNLGPTRTSALFPFKRYNFAITKMQGLPSLIDFIY